MIIESNKTHRDTRKESLTSDLVVVGGGLAGVCCAITAARQGINVVLIQDRPVLGGNASSEVRLWALGATSHMGNNNRWAREGGVIDELVVENLYRNPEGSPIIFDTVLLEKVWQEKNITVLLNTAVYSTLKKSDSNSISSVKAYCSQNSTDYEVSASLFCDASGDGIVGFQSGAAFRMGAETKEEFNEAFAPSKEYGELLGHSIYFMSKDLGKPVDYIPPAFALKDITKIPRYRNFNVKDQACWMWWIEYGGRLDTIHDSEKIKWELWKVVYGVWDYIKNSGNFPEAANLTLEWVGAIPGKRESRRFEGHYMLNQSDIVEQKQFYDTVSYGGWAIDLHPADGVFSEKPGCNQWHSKGVYEIPYRCMISKNIDNLFLAGRIISASHLAFGSSRVMMTCAHGAQAVGMAAALSIANNCKPSDWLAESKIHDLQQALLSSGQYIPHKALDSKSESKVEVSSSLKLSKIPFDGDWTALEFSNAQLLPIAKGPMPKIIIEAKATAATSMKVSLRKSSKQTNYTPDITLEELTIPIHEGVQSINLGFNSILDEDCYVFVCFHENESLLIRNSKSLFTGLVSVVNKHNKAVSNYGKQEPDPSIGFESFEFWTPYRRPQGSNIAMTISPALSCFGMENLDNGYNRPTVNPNAWIASPKDKSPRVTLTWKESKTISKIVLNFDTDWDYPMETTIWGHGERVMPFVIRDYQIINDKDQVIFQKDGNYQTRNVIRLDAQLDTTRLTFKFDHPSKKHVPAAVFSIDIS